ncbi:Diphthamide biosynthesis protein 4 [Curvularia clavata]|uniref:Diphthamide biosynthesis protein 4 n=1 Tax=Curvularia clavata TaxID=95742 RepID=A0A9Q8ZEB7_CURCL|nr:Diphthamide biosynthesis protein 4 [Curvularia clavata]
MAYTKDYYNILGLDAPGWRSAKHTSNVNNFTADLRRAYKVALLAAHPDKKSSSTKTTPAGYTIDDIKEAYTTLADPRTRAEYETWFLHHRDTLPTSSSVAAVERDKAENDFILGLEVLDLSEFECTSTKSTQAQQADEEERMQWTRACRCGAEKGFLILEEELEDAEARGEKEVLVGCEGCSLWIRVGFDVEEG